MAFYRKNIGGAHQVLRIALGVVGYCPFCAVAGGERRSGS
jgi:hypothetical protein